MLGFIYLLVGSRCMRRWILLCFCGSSFDFFSNALLVLLEGCAEENAPANKEKINGQSHCLQHLILSFFLCESNVER